MMGPVEKLLSISAKLYEHLKIVPAGEERDIYIDKINTFLDERGRLINELQNQDKVLLKGHQLASHITELDQGIQHRLNKVMSIIKTDMKNLQQTKKSEQTYLNPYGKVRVMDGMYFDGKK